MKPKNEPIVVKSESQLSRSGKARRAETLDRKLKGHSFYLKPEGHSGEDVGHNAIFDATTDPHRSLPDSVQWVMEYTHKQREWADVLERCLDFRKSPETFAALAKIAKAARDADGDANKGLRVLGEKIIEYRDVNAQVTGQKLSTDRLGKEMGIKRTGQRIGQIVNTVEYFAGLAWDDSVDFKLYEVARTRNLKAVTPVSPKKLIEIIKQNPTVGGIKGRIFCLREPPAVKHEEPTAAPAPSGCELRLLVRVEDGKQRTELTCWEAGEQIHQHSAWTNGAIDAAIEVLTKAKERFPQGE